MSVAAHVEMPMKQVLVRPFESFFLNIFAFLFELCVGFHFLRGEPHALHNDHPDEYKKLHKAWLEMGREEVITLYF